MLWVFFVIFSPSVFPSLFSPHLHTCIFHLPLFPFALLMTFRVRNLLPRALKPCYSDQPPRCHLPAVNNAESRSPPSTPPQNPKWFTCTLKFGKHCSKVQTHSHIYTQNKLFANSRITLTYCELFITLSYHSHHLILSSLIQLSLGFILFLLCTFSKGQE